MASHGDTVCVLEQPAASGGLVEPHRAKPPGYPPQCTPALGSLEGPAGCAPPCDIPLTPALEPLPRPQAQLCLTRRQGYEAPHPVVPLGSLHLLSEQAHGCGASHADSTGAPGALRDTGTLTLPCGKRTSVPTPTPCPSFPVCKIQYKASSPQ